MDNMTIYDAVRAVPNAAKKEITSGRLKGKTDINPMWRIKVLTEQFGPCGVGWKYTIDRQWTELGAYETVAAFCNISLYIKVDGEWSEAIPGTGGSAFVAKESNGLHTSDECFKMALTDAISVAAKALGVAADVYWDKDKTKYDQGDASTERKPKARPIPCEGCGKLIVGVRTKDKQNMSPEEVAAYSERRFGRKLCAECQKAAAAADQAPSHETDN